MMFKGTKKDIHTIARDVQVQYVLEGSVRKVENKLRITAQLIDALNDAHLWADKYSGKLEDVFDIQEKVSGSIVDALKLTLSPEEKRRIAEQRIDDINAYECYLRARQETLRWTEEGFTRALKLLQNGLAVLGENAFLYGAIGYTYWQHVSAGFHPSEYDHYLQETERYAKRALALNPNSEQGHLLLGLLSLFRGKRSDLQSTVRSLKRALEIAPDNPDALLWLVAAYTFAGKGFAARPLAQRLLEIDPLNSFSQIIPGWIDYFDGMIEASLDAGRKAHGMEPDNALTCTAYVLFLAGNQRLDEVGSIVNQMANDAPNATATRSVRFLRYALEKDKREATRVLTSELREGARWDLYYSYLIACGHALLEMKEEAIEWLEHAASLGLINYPFLSNYDPLLENVRSDSRFRELMERVKHEWEHFEV